jgi:hypothetical protein
MMTRRYLLWTFLIPGSLAANLPALASGTLYDVGVLQRDFRDVSGATPISADNDGTWIWTASGGSPDGQRLARYFQDGSPDQSFAPNIDFRSLYVDNSGQLYAKEFGIGAIFSISQTGVPTFLYDLNDPEAQSAASLNGDDTELYTMSAPTLRRYNAANGAFIGSVNLSGMAGDELAFPQAWQMETNGAGRILTFANGVVSEWDLSGTRIGQCTVPVGTPTGFDTNWSFGVGSDDLVYVFNENNAHWEAYDVGIGGPVAVEPTSWGRVKALYRSEN